MQIVKDFFSYMFILLVFFFMLYACLSQAAYPAPAKEKRASRVTWDKSTGWFKIHETYNSMRECNLSLLFVDNTKHVCLVLYKGNLKNEVLKK